MEEPFKGKALIEQQIDGVQITIPSDKNFWQAIFLAFWVVVWACGLFFAINTILGGPFLLMLFILIWIVIWLFAGLFAIKLFLWRIYGKEILLVCKDSISIKIDIPFWGNCKVYDLKISKKFRVKEDDYNFYGIFANRRNDFGKIVPEGRIRFDYGLKTVKFGGGIDEAEATYILSFLKEKNYLQEKNFEN